MAAMMVILFAATATGCQNENEITPNPGSGVTTPPVVTPPAAVSVPKPKEIITVVNGMTTRIQSYTYDSQGMLTIYASKNEASVDSVIMQPNQVSYRSIRSGGLRVNMGLALNSNKTYKRVDLLSSSTGGVVDQAIFNHNAQFRIDSITQPRTDLPLARFDYISNNLNGIQMEVQKINVNYSHNLSYQKGINEIPFSITPVKYFKLLEQEDATTTQLYNKLLKQIIINNGTGRFELHDFVYEFDGQNRVSKITDTITFTTSSTSVQKIAVSTITYRSGFNIP